MLISEAKQIIKHANSTRTHLKVIKKKPYIMEDRPSSTTWTNCNHCCTVHRVSTVLFYVCLWVLTVILALISPSIQQSGVLCIFLIDVSFRQSVFQLSGRERNGRFCLSLPSFWRQIFPTVLGLRVLGRVSFAHFTGAEIENLETLGIHMCL